MRSWILLILLSALLALTAACGGDDDDGDDAAAEPDTVAEVDETPTPEPEPTATEVPEPEPTETPEPEPTPTEVVEPEPTEEPASTDDSDSPASEGESGGELAGLLLSIDDLPSGWTETFESAGEDMDLDDVSDDPFEAPCGIEPLDEAYDPVAEADRSFQGTELGPFLSQNLMQLSSSDEAAQVLDTVRQLFGCEEWTESDEFGDEITFQITEVPFDGVGDDSFAIQLGLSFGDEPEMDMFGDFAFDLVFLQRGPYVSMFTYADLFGVSDADFGALVQLGDDKLK